MLESLAAWVLRTYVGEYVENLNTDQLSIGYGTVELENLPLRKTALQGLELPLEVKSGFIGRLKLSIPFRHPKSEPWIIHIDKLYLIAGPLCEYQYDEEQEKKKESERKQKQLDGLEMQWQFGRSKESATESWWTSIYSSLSTTIMENLQLVVNDVHVRYEDNILNPENPFAVGITIEKLAMESANQNWEPEFLVSESQTKFKLIEIQKFALYWDSDTSLVGDLPSKDLNDALCRIIGRQQGMAGFSQHEYILHPLSSQVKLQRNCSAVPLRDKEEPRFIIDIHLEKIAISLADVQYQNLSKLMEEFQRHFRSQKYRKWRPLLPKKHNAKAWWQFAGKCVLNFIEERNKRQTWSFTITRAQTIVKYVNVYTKHLTEATEDVNATVIQKEIEDELSFEELKVLRSIAVAIVRKEEALRRAAEIKHSQSQQNSTQNDASAGWLSGWWGWYGASEESTTVDTSLPPNVASEGPQTEEEEQFLEEIQEGNTDDSIFKRDTVFANLNFHLDSGQFKLLTTKNRINHGELQPLVEIVYADVRWMSRVCPRSSTWRSNMSLRSILVKDKMSEGNIFHYLVSGQPKQISEDSPNESVFQLEFEKMPKSSKIGYGLKIRTQPLQIVYNPATIERISDFFRRQTISTKKADLHAIEQQILDAAWARYEELKTQTKTGLYHAMDDLLLGQVKTQDKRWNIEMFIAAPQIILPESFQEKNASMILVDLGNLSFVTKSGSAKTSQDTQNKVNMEIEGEDDDDSFVTPPSTPPSEDEMDGLPAVASLSELKESFTAESLADKVYDRYTLELADLQVLVAKIDEYRKKQSSGIAGSLEEFSIVDKFTISLQLERRLIFTADPKWPSVTVSGDLPKLNLYFSEIKVQTMWKCMANLWGSNNSITQQQSSDESVESFPNLSLNETSKSLLDLTEVDYYKLTNQDTYDSATPSLSHQSSDSSLDCRQKLGQLSEESCQVLGQFCINELCVFLSGRGRVIAELKVDGVKSSYTKRPYDMSLSLMVYDIFLVDRVQTYGPEFQMLLSSHDSSRNKCVTPVHPVANKVFILDSSENVDQPEFDSVVTVDYNQINTNSPSLRSEQPMRIASIQFNSVKFIANQETIVELMNFINTLFPSGGTQSSTANLQTITENEVAKDLQEKQDDESPVSMEITATFHQLNVQFIRGLTLENQSFARKVADVNIIDLWTQVTFGDKQIIEGSLGGLHVLDVTPEDICHREVLSVGVLMTGSPRSNSGVFQDFDSGGEAKKAFTFTLVKPKPTDIGSHPPADESLSKHIRLSVHMASAHYTHTHRFISELTRCFDDFSSHANAVAQSLRSAATSMAMGLVTKQKSLADGIDYFSSSFTQGSSGLGLEPRSSSRRPSVDSWDGAVERNLGPIASAPESKRRVYAHVTIETPVVILPRTSSSQERLVAHLGRIVIYNTHLTSYDHSFQENCRRTNSDSNINFSFNDSATENNFDQTSDSSTDFDDIDRVYIDITDMSLYSLGLAKGGARCSENGTGVAVSEHILHNTALRLVVDRCCRSGPGDEAEGEISETDFGESSKPTILVSGRVTKPLQLVLSNRAYKQLLSTNDTLSGKTERNMSGSRGTSTASSAVTSPIISPVSSSFDLENANQVEPVPMNVDQSNDSGPSENLSITPEGARTPIRASFDVPRFNIELRGDLKDGEQGIVNVFFQDFELLYKNTVKSATYYDVSLGGLAVEDLLQNPDSLYRNMMVSSSSLSKTSKGNLKRNEALSKSCPDISGFFAKDAHSTSLPMELGSNPRGNGMRASSPLRPMFQHRRMFALRAEEMCEDTEDRDESVNDSVEEFLGKRDTYKETGDDTLVKIKALMVDRTSEEYITKYNKTDRFVEVDFNSLDTTVNLQTWVVFLEFFGIGRAPDEINTAQKQDAMNIERQIETESSLPDGEENSIQEHINSQYKVRVSSLSLTLNKVKYPLAKIKIAGLSSLVNMRENDMNVKGKLMKINLVDMSPHGKMYREKFTTCGEEALDFDFFRYGDPDPELRHEYDMNIKLRMSAVQYVHTKRFQSELMAFVNHFSQIQESLRRMRTVAAGNEVAEMSTRATRISLDIIAGSPLMIFPKSSTSEDLLVASLGHMTLRNQFLFADDEGTILRGLSSEAEDDELEILPDKSCGSEEVGPPCMLDHMEVELVDIDLFSAVSISQQGDVFLYKRQGNKLFKETCKLDLMIERNLDWARSRAVPDMSIWGALSSMHVNLDYSQYGLILGFLNQNLGEPLEAFERPSSFVADHLDDQTSSDTNLWTTIKMIIDLVNVKVELLPSTSLHNQKTFIEPACYSLAKIDFIKSKFVFEGFSDWSKTMDLVSQDVLLYDTRHEGSDERYFKEVLRPGKQLAVNQTGSPKNSLMFEVHYRDSPTRTTMTFIFNNSRITLLLDAILDIYNFIMNNWDKPSQDKSQPAVDTKSQSSTGDRKSEDGNNVQTDQKNDNKNQKSFEMKVNVSGSEFVALQNVDIEDTDAIILRMTAVLAWRPHYKSQKPLSCSVQSLEIFSCNLSCEEESALSIIDPMAGLIELNAAERHHKRKTQGLLDATLESLPSLEVTLNSLNMRISYNDYKLYQRIAESLSKQLSNAIDKERTGSEPKVEEVKADYSYLYGPSLKRLQELGFDESDCIRALNECRGDVETAASWLLLNATPSTAPVKPAGAENKSKLSGFQIRANSVCVCLIDDCGDNDVPLTELLLQHLYFWYELHGVSDSSAQCTLTAEYYNRSVSGWEPLVEPWKCQVHWQKQRRTVNSPENLLVKVDAADRLDLNITSSLISMIQTTLKNWSDDYYGPAFLDPSSNKRDAGPQQDDAQSESNSSDVPTLGHFRKRAPFVPFLLQNQTGCSLHFATVTSSPSKVVMTTTGLVFSGRVHNSNISDSSKKLSEWRELQPGDEVPFEFKQSREKQRHKETHELKVHQLVVQLEGWEQVSPVSVDKVGAFFRQAMPAKGINKVIRFNPTRVVFDIKLENGAQKVVTVKSALVLKNKTDLTIDVKLELPRGEAILPSLTPQSDFAVPLPYVQSPLFVRPHGKNTRFSTTHLHWRDVRENFEDLGYFIECPATSGRTGDNYRYCVSVQRDGFPVENSTAEHPLGKYEVTQPAHTITILPPIVLVNLLPVDLSYCIRGHSIGGNIKPGLLSPVYKVNRASSLSFTFSMENFPHCEVLTIPELSVGAESCIRHIEIKDTKNRVLRLNAKIELRPGLSLKISIFASFWLVNDTGMPLIFKQEGCSAEMAGQFDEHEMARSLTPLLFSFNDKDGSFRCQMRIGKGQHKDVGRPVWCTSFSLEYPREFTRVHSKQPDRRPDMVYDVGIDVRFGQGRFRDTRIVTFAPRYQFENRSAHTLAFQQRHFVREQETRNPDGTLTSPPGAQVVWHWERTDLDQLLCIRLNDIPDCRWSGGFKIDRDNSSHVSMRCSNGGLLFIRAEVMLKGAVFHIVFTDANQLPPPYRIDNMSEVPILFYQSRTEEHQRCLLQPKQSVPYAWDEPTLPRELTCGIVNDGSFIHFNLDKLGEKDKLYYYNAIYIAFTHTLTRSEGVVSRSFSMKPVDPSNIYSEELVLDVPQGTAVILSKKEPYKRTQLWRMTSSGILFNEGSSPPFDPRKPSSSSAGFVLDVGHLDPLSFARNRKSIPLILSKLSSQRKDYQTWSFTEDGRMKNQIKDYFVSSKPGLGLYQGSDALLCCSVKSSSAGKVPKEQQISIEKLRPGSGMLLVKVLADGPTRAIRISDVRQQTEEDYLAKDWMVVERRGGLRQTTVTSGGANAQTNKRTEIQMRLAGGIGISLINGVPEELVFATFSPIEMDYITTAFTRRLELSIGNIQVDDQLYLTQYPVMVFVTPSSKDDCTVSEPAISISAANEPTKLQNCEIFKNLNVSLRKLTLQVDEKLLFKLLQFFGWVYNDDDVTVNQDSENLGIETHRTSSSVSPSSLKRYYFEKFLFNAVQLRVSVATVTRLPEDLKQIKSSMGLILVRLQGAVVDLESFSRTHAFDTRTALLDALSKHYSEELRGQAPFILASVDFLGNPMGLFNDVSSGLEGLVRRGNVGGLFLNVAHGLSDSAAKLTGSLSDGLWSASSDSKSLESREAMKAERQHQSSGDHLVAGIKGLGMGLVGGLTSIVTQPIEGASEKGVPGFLQGIGKGILGTFAKPTAGVLDLASGVSAAVRGSATRSSRLYQPKRVRSIRNCFGPGGAIPRFSKTNSEGQSIVLKLNANNMDEKFITSESVRTDIDGRVKVLLTNEKVYFVKTSGIPSPESILVSLRFEDVLDCHHLKNDVDYVELSRKYSEPPVRVRCEAASAQKLVQKINYAKSLFEEVKHTVIVKSTTSVT
ncbi:vacuolar protein sorting-associated protein 13D-like [Dendronephthya gigantea]|uniref:vacuolar protein sorting-associated protein 13D-like n=1 Tax=Dendronephthya gigantea TaxID=151771 RepID=UPI00106B77A0|nr:vacuolar protein sorting-associated protein 13D-like [Dendronephthya gigantea]